MAARRIWIVLVGVFSFLVVDMATSSDVRSRTLKGVRFLVTVNVTDYDGCMATVATGMVRPNIKSDVWNISGCDHGPIHYTVESRNNTDELVQIKFVRNRHSGESLVFNGARYMTVSLVYYSYVIEDADPPRCRISWNGTYLLPRKPDATQDLLPVCFTTDSREGWHFTYYWFHILEWAFE